MPSGDTDVGSASVDGKCRICAGAISKSVVKCANPKCNVIVHLKCFDAMSKIVFLSKENWCCKYCMKASISDVNISDNLIIKKENDCLIREKELLNKLLQELEYTNKLQKEKIDLYEAKSVSTTYLSRHDNQQEMASSYSAVTKKVNSSSAVLFVKSTNKLISNTQVEMELKAKVNPTSISAGVLGTKLIKDGVLIKCSDTNSLNKLRDTITKEISNSFSVTEPKKYNPRICIHGVEKSFSENSNFIKEIICSNDLECTEDDIKIVTKLKLGSTVNVIIQVTPTIFKIILNRGFLYAGWKRCGVREHFNIPRCYKCCQLGHIKKRLSK